MPTVTWLMILALRYSLCIFVLTGLNGASAQTHAPNSITTQTRYLSGKGPSDAVAWDFFCLEGRNAGKWSSMST